MGLVVHLESHSLYKLLRGPEEVNSKSKCDLLVTSTCPRYNTQDLSLAVIPSRWYQALRDY
jgi:hypothetical protein